MFTSILLSAFLSYHCVRPYIWNIVSFCLKEIKVENWNKERKNIKAENSKKKKKKKNTFRRGRKQTSPLTFYYINIYRQQRTCAQIYEVCCTIDCILRSKWGKSFDQTRSVKLSRSLSPLFVSTCPWQRFVRAVFHLPASCWPKPFGLSRL